MWVKNEKTGHTWCVNDDHGKRLLKEDHFSEVKAPKENKAGNKKSDLDE